MNPLGTDNAVYMRIADRTFRIVPHSRGFYWSITTGPAMPPIGSPEHDALDADVARAYDLYCERLNNL